MALVFPSGIIISNLIGGEYFTANIFLFPGCIVHKTAKIKDVIKFLFLCLLGNIFGGILFAWIVGYWTENLTANSCAIIAENRSEETSLFFLIFF